MARIHAPQVEVFSFVSRFVSILAILITLVLVGQILASSNVPSTTPLFSPVVNYNSGGSGANSVIVSDVNLDGKPDLVVANQSITVDSPYGSVGVLLGRGDGTFEPAATYISGDFAASSIAVADVNGDGKPDLLVANLCAANTSCLSGGVVDVLLGNGDGTFQPAMAYPSGGSYPQSIAVADVNMDGKPDLVLANYLSGMVGVLLGNGDGTFQPAAIYDPGGLPTAVAIGDVNGDRNPDLVVATLGRDGRVAMLLGQGDGTYQLAGTYPSSGLNPVSVAIADVNGDGKADVLVTNNFSSTIGVLLGNGDATFKPTLTYASGGFGPLSIAMADVNGDGRPDIIVANCALAGDTGCGPGHGVVAVLPGNGDGTFQPAITNDSGAFIAQSVAVADVNGDSKPDAVVANACADFVTCDGSIGVLLNNTPFCATPPVVTLSAAPTLLWPPNGKMVPVTVSGKVTDTGCTIQTAAYAVKDEYGEVQPSGPVTLGVGGAFSFTVWLQASRLGTDPDGRLYTVSVSATNNDGKTRSRAGTIMVPHDQGN